MLATSGDLLPYTDGALECSAETTVDSEMVDVFSDAYSSGGHPDDVGYYALPVAYSEAFRQAMPRPPAYAIFAKGSVGGECVAIASVVLIGKDAGLYSVATKHSFRRRGFGRAISMFGLSAATQRGAANFFLQTEADSPVEEMYEGIGFKRSFIGQLISPV